MNGDGVLVREQVGSGTVTRSTQDLAAPLSQILSDGTTSYVYGADRLFRLSGSTRTWELHDGLGSVTRTSADAGVGVGATPVFYEPFGAVQSGTPGLFGFTGERQSGANVYLRARWYNASNGTFTSRDPWAGDSTRPDTLNSYACVGNRPTMLTDASGQCYPPFEMLRTVEPGNCANLDAAYHIYEHPRAHADERSQALAYITTFWASHGIGAVGVAGLGWAGASVASVASMYGAATVSTAGYLLTTGAPTTVTALGVGLLALNSVDDVAAWIAALCGDADAAGYVQLGIADNASPIADLFAAGMVIGGRPGRGLLHAAEGAASGGQTLVDVLVDSGESVSINDILAIGRNNKGRIIWLETGVTKAEGLRLKRKGGSGLAHILEEHEQDFINKGVAVQDIPSLVFEAATTGKTLEYKVLTERYLRSSIKVEPCVLLCRLAGTAISLELIRNNIFVYLEICNGFPQPCSRWYSGRFTCCADTSPRHRG